MAPGDPTSSDVGFLGEVRERARPVDVAALLVAPAVLTWVHTLPRPVRAGLAFDRSDPSLVTAFTAHYVHLDAAHLGANLAVYALIVPASYLLFLLSDRRGRFLSVLAFVTIGLPLVVTGIATVVVDHGRLLGFSGLALAFVGVLPVALFGFLDERTGPALTVEDAPVLFLAGLALVAIRALPGRTGLAIALGAAGLSAGYGLRIWGLLPRPRGPALRRWLGRPGYAELAAAGPALFLVALWAAFPPVAARGGTVVDLFGHFVGYSLGFLVPFLVAVTAGRLRRQPPPSPPPDVGEPP